METCNRYSDTVKDTMKFWEIKDLYDTPVISSISEKIIHELYIHPIALGNVNTVRQQLLKHGAP